MTAFTQNSIGGGPPVDAPQTHATVLDGRAKEPLRVLIVSEVSGFMRGGVPTETARLISGLNAQGHQIGFLGDIPVDKIARHFALGSDEKSLSANLARAVEEFKPDVVHLMAVSSVGMFRISALLKSIPCVFTCHSLPPRERKLSWFHWNENAHYAVRHLRYVPNTLAWKWLCKNGIVPHAIVHSDPVRKIIIQYGQPEHRATLIPLGYESIAAPGRPVKKMDRRLRIVTVGGIAHTKGYHDALMAIVQLRQSVPEIEYDMIGEIRDQSYVRYLESIIEQFRLADIARIMPNVTDVEKLERLKRADVYLQPSHEEGFCLSYIEAASIVPRLVGTDTGAIREISADDIGSRVVQIGEPSQIAKAIKQLVAVSLPDDLLGQRQKRLDERYSWSRYIEAHEKIYLRTIDEFNRNTAKVRDPRQINA